MKNIKPVFLSLTFLAAMGVATIAYSAQKSTKHPAQTKHASSQKHAAQAKPQQLAEFEGFADVAEGLDAFEQVCLDEKGKIRDISVTNAELLADPNGGAIDCMLAAEVLREQLERFDRDLDLHEAKLATLGGAK